MLGKLQYTCKSLWYIELWFVKNRRCVNFNTINGDYFYKIDRIYYPNKYDV